jgi:hypothetical protein
MMNLAQYTAISIKVVPEQSGKVEYEPKGLLGIAKKLRFFFRHKSYLDNYVTNLTLASFSWISNE